MRRECSSNEVGSSTSSPTIFPDDGQRVSDPEWIDFGLSRGWQLLTQDNRIRRQPAALEVIRRYAGTVFCLSSAELPVAVRAERFDGHREEIERHMLARHSGFFVVYETEVIKRWP